ncbi:MULTISPECIES: WhiB family transcriptional regulator [unclassified Nocardioides]|uniref:WhiB family transcriptional regulator n=1 Tax=unclassified Nocardioides TaxID=2615069 RepID=UPI0006F2FFCD|nr:MULTISPECIES: WhiB family transcriptional regulator [unclassified Nocardioides]KQY64307.1 DNA-binding protein [Nocardioides sp. Root140]KQZ70226.1 DNA-binding protein [Nocardioides sp. Root151]KRF16323.1 DNA-binding protein [Nocardioides sp. Soil796]
MTSPPCTQSPHLFFAEHPAALDRARQLCAQCPLALECLTGALERGEPYGVWGGQIVIDGAVVAHKRGRGRPRKDEAA